MNGSPYSFTLIAFPHHCTVKDLSPDAASTARGFPSSCLFAVAVWEKNNRCSLEPMSGLPSLESRAWSSLWASFVSSTWSPALCWEPSAFSLLCQALHYGHPCFLGFRKWRANGLELEYGKGKWGAQLLFLGASPAAVPSDPCLTHLQTTQCIALVPREAPVWALVPTDAPVSGSSDPSSFCPSRPRVKSQ